VDEALEGLKKHAVIGRQLWSGATRGHGGGGDAGKELWGCRMMEMPNVQRQIQVVEGGREHQTRPRQGRSFVVVKGGRVIKRP
jgi:hypothetical protein